MELGSEAGSRVRGRVGRAEGEDGHWEGSSWARVELGIWGPSIERILWSTESLRKIGIEGALGWGVLLQ